MKTKFKQALKILTQDSRNINALVDHLFRREAGKMVAVLTRVFGFYDLETAEDIVQETMYKALQEWPFHRVPDNPQAWLYKVARNKAIDRLRKEKRLTYNTDNVAGMALMEKNVSGRIDDLFMENEIQDSQLRMIFACCSPEINQESQVALTLKTLCGFSIKEIAKAFVTSEDTINKRLLRARQKIRDQNISLEVPLGNQLIPRLNTVLKTIYLLFNEGYNASSENYIRKDVCLEAMRLALLLTEQDFTNTADAQALVALMCFHAARFESRVDAEGNIILLKDQDRDLWDKELIRKGYEYLTKATGTQSPGEYSLEAGIMGVHCGADSYDKTDWGMILRLYDALLSVKNTPVVQLNRAIVFGQIQGPQAAIDYILTQVPAIPYYLYDAILGDLYARNGEPATARTYFQKAISLTSSAAERQLLEKKLAALH